MDEQIWSADGRTFIEIELGIAVELSGGGVGKPANTGTDRSLQKGFVNGIISVNRCSFCEIRSSGDAL